MEIFAAALLGVYSTVCALLAVFGTYRIVLLAAGLRARRQRLPPSPPDVWPRVTVQLPLYNERFVARRLLEAVARLDYPRSRLQIQILDDSTDRTRVLTRRLAAVLRRRGLDVDRVHRAHRDGFKAGALARGLETASGDLLAIFDADFVPPADFLRRMVPSVMQPGVGVVQARWGHLNRDASVFTRLQAILLDGHFAIEQPARCAHGWLLTFNGTAGIWRREAIDSAGGWSSETLTEDLDLSLRAQLAGWRIEYRDDVVVPAELPGDPDSLRSQQRRWSKGGVQVARRMLPRIARSPLPLLVKVEALLHLSSYAAYPLLVLLALLRTPARVFGGWDGWLGLLPGEAILLAIGTLPLAWFYVLAQRRAHTPGGTRRWLRDAFPAMALGAGLALANAIAVIEGLCGRGVHFERTPKHGGWGARDAGDRGAARRPIAAPIVRRRLPSYRVSGVRLALLELLLLGYLLACKLVASNRSPFGEFPFLAFFTFGLLTMALPSLREAWHVSRARSPRRLAVAAPVP